MRVFRHAAILACALSLACTAIIGDDFEIADGAGGTATGGNAGATGGSGGMAGDGGSGGGDCPAGFADCNGDTSDGCEAELAADPNHCGACDRGCGTDNTTAVACGAGVCVPSCADGFGDCTTPNPAMTDDGCETPLGVPTDCAACGHDCASGGCALGLCEPFTIFASAANGSVRSVAIDTTSIYWADRTLGTINSALLAGGNHNALLENVLQPLDVAIDDGHVYFFEDGGGLFSRVPIGGGARSNITSGARTIGASATHVYFDNGSRIVRRMKNDLLGASEAIAGTLSANSIAIEGTDVFFTSGSSVRHFNESNDTLTLLYIAPTSLGRLALDATNLYIVSLGGDEVFQAARDGSDIDVLSLATGADINGIAAIGDHVYYTRTNAGEVHRVPIGGGTSELVTAEVPRPHSLAADASGIYVSSFVNPNIYKVVPPPM